MMFVFVFLKDHCCVLNSIVGWDSTIGKWARVEGTPSDPNPNDPYAKMDSETLFREGKLTPSITILGKPFLTLSKILNLLMNYLIFIIFRSVFFIIFFAFFKNLRIGISCISHFPIFTFQ